MNPEIDQPEMHLQLDWNGKLNGLDIRGKKTIDTCNLNRVNLALARRKIIQRYVNSILSYFFKFRDGTIDALALKKFLHEQVQDCKVNSNPVYEYSFVYYSIFKQSDDFVDNQLYQLSDIEKSLIMSLFN